MPDPDYSKLEGYEPPAGLEGYTPPTGPSDLDYVTAQAGKDATAARDSLAQTVGGAATKREDFESLKDAATMVPAGATMDWDDELIGHLGAIGAALGSPLKDPRVTAPQGYRMQRDAQRARKGHAMKRSPWAAPLGYLGGAVLQQGVAGSALRGVTGVGGRLARLATGTERAAEGAGVGARMATGAGNAAVPGALIGAGQAESMEDVPANAAVGAVLGVGGSALANAPGAMRRMAGHPAVAKFARKAEIDSALRAAGANRTVGKQIEQDFPGGQEAFVEQQRSMGIGTGAFPSPRAALDQSRAAAERVGAERKALEAQASDLMIPSEEVASEVEARGRALPWPAEDALRTKYLDEADKLRQMGRPIYKQVAAPHDPRVPIDAEIIDVDAPMSTSGVKGLPPPRSTALDRYTHRSPELPPGLSDPPAPPIQAKAQILEPAQPPAPEMVGREVSFPELNSNLRSYNKNAYLAQREKQGQLAEVNRGTGHVINDILERHANKLPEEVGTPWRQKKRMENVAIRSEDMAAAGQSGSNLGKGIKMATAAAGLGAGMFNPAFAIPAAAGLAVAHPGVQMRMAQGLGAISRAAAKPPTSLERVLSRFTPSGQNAGRLLAHGQAQESVTAVQEAALRGDEQGVSEHYKRMLTDPSYNRLALEEE